MFEQNPGQTPNPNEVEDIFAGSPKGPPAPPPPLRRSLPPPPGAGVSGRPLAPPRGPAPMPPPPGPELETKAGIRPKPFIIGGVVLLLLIVIGVGIWYFVLRSGGSPASRADREPTTPAAPAPRPSGFDDEPFGGAPASEPEPVAEPEPEPEPVPEPEPLPVDTDGDGLTDEEEALLGTSPDTADTDGDQLFDKEERDVYGTSPTNPDTDGDGYGDGTEVRNGYNPSGPGRLFEVPTQ